MGKVLFLALLIGAGWYAHERWFTVSPAYQAYQRFAEAHARQDWTTLSALATGAAAEEIDALRGASQTRHLDLYGQHMTMSMPNIAELAGEVSWIEYQRESEEPVAGGGVHLVAVQTVCRIPVGTASAICKWPVSFRQQVELAPVAGDWRVERFAEERLGK